MVHKTLPKTLVKRVRRMEKARNKERIMADYFIDSFGRLNTKAVNVPSNFERQMGKMEIADHRKEHVTVPKNETHYWGRRVRVLNVKRNYPKIGKVVIKRHHYAKHKNSRETIRHIRRLVEEHNKQYPNQIYVLKKPIAYHLGKKYVLMAHADMPSMEEIIGQYGIGGQILNKPTTHGKAFLAEMRIRNPQIHWLNKTELKNITNLIIERMHKLGMSMDESELLLAGIEGNKPVFVPLIDLE